MPLVRTRNLLRDARNGGYGIGAFNVENAEMVRAVCLAAAQANMPVILQTTPSTLRYLDCRYFAGIAGAAAAETGVTAALHLDHGDSFELARACIDAGYTSVMIDGSKLPFEDNIALTARVVDYAGLYGVDVEAELGTVGGKEDDLENEDSRYTDPSQAAEFTQRTGIGSLAVAFGTAHGVYQTPPVLDIGRVALIRERVEIPLVMHGTSGIPDEKVREAIRNGICKVNYATELRAAFSGAVGAYFQGEPRVIDPKKYLSAGLEKVRALVTEKIAMLSRKM